MADLPYLEEEYEYIGDVEPLEEVPCEKELTWRRYRRLKPVSLSFGPVAKPRGAPKSRKTNKQVLADLTTKADKTIKRLNARKAPKCGKGCEYLGQERKVIKIRMTVRDLWEETFKVRDAKGNVIDGKASYLSEGHFSAEMTVIKYYCGPILGDPAPDFFDTSFDNDLEDVVRIVDYDLASWFETLSPEERADMEFTPGSKV